MTYWHEERQRTIDTDDYCFTSLEPYQRWREAVAQDKAADGREGWIDFVDTSRALADSQWPEFTDDLDFFDAHSEILCN